MNYEVIDHENDISRVYEDKEDALKKSIDMKDESDNVEIIETDKEPEVEPEPVSEEEPAEIVSGDGGAQVAQPVEKTNGQEPQPDEIVRNVVDAEDMPDPLVTVPEWMTTTVSHGNDESVDLNKRGTQVIANALGYNVDAECEIEAIENDFEYSRYRATVTTEDGETFTAVGDAHIKEKGNNREDLERLAETRAKKRAVKWATGGGLAAFMEQDDE